MSDSLLLEDKLPVLARELAMGIYEVEDILSRYGVGWDELERIRAMARFQQLLETTTVEWGSTLNTRERIKVKALAGVEDGLPGLFHVGQRHQGDAGVAGRSLQAGKGSCWHRREGPERDPAGEIHPHHQRRRRTARS